ncbi:MAG: hypothetical protein QOG20_659 [Pseudonocardiales bacterium]|jgi:hypothetical protein|nr:hypothetical protein [Pseudonocardiales bacterium]
MLTVEDLASAMREGRLSCGCWGLCAPERCRSGSSLVREVWQALVALCVEESAVW